ncbi:hypothetical protein ACFL1P_00105 [Patescibacteria group bacterium]
MKSNILLFITIFILLISIVLYIYTSSSEDEIPDIAPTLSLISNIGEHNEFGKIITSCELLIEDEGITDFIIEDSSILPSIFPIKPEYAKLCGYSSSKQSVYYLFDEEDRILLDYYKEKMEINTCTTTGIQKAPPGRSYSYLLPYDCRSEGGVIAVNAINNTYVIQRDR